MDSSLAVRPISVTAAAASRPDPAPVQQAVSTDLTPSEAVTATADATPTRNDALHPAVSQQAATPARSASVLIDPSTAEVVYRVLDVRTGEVVRQVPASSALGSLRAYRKALENGATPIEAQDKADTEA